MSTEGKTTRPVEFHRIYVLFVKPMSRPPVILTLRLQSSATTAPIAVVTTRLSSATTIANPITLVRETTELKALADPATSDTRLPICVKAPVELSTVQTRNIATTPATARHVATRNESFTVDQKSTYTSRRRTCLAGAFRAVVLANRSATFVICG